MRTLGKDPSEEEVQKMILEIDENGNGMVEFDEFVILMVKQSCKESYAEEELVEIFKIFDKDGDGKISVQDLMEQFVQLGDPINDEDARKMIRHADVDGDGSFSFTEFLKVMMYNTEDKSLSDPAFNKK